MPAFPGTVTPLAWFDGASGAFFSDAAGSAPAAVGELVRRVNEVAPLTHNWQTPAGQLARRDVGGLCLEPTQPSAPLQSSSNATALTSNDFTFVASWVKRDGDPQLLTIGVPESGVSPTSVKANFGGFYALPGFTTRLGSRHTIGVVFKSTFIQAILWTDGVETASATLTMAVSGGSPNANEYTVGQFQNSFYGILAQWGVVARGVNGTELGQLIAYADARPAGTAYPLNKPLLIVDGDSIAVGSPGPTPYESWRYTLLRNLREDFDAEMLLVANGGSSTAGHFANAAPYLSNSRGRQVVVFAAGTNDLAAAGEYSAEVIAEQYLSTLESYRADGCYTVAATVLDRRGMLSVTQSSYDTRRAQLNDIIRAAAGVRYDELADVALIPQLGLNGAAESATYFVQGGDKTHPTGAGHALLAPIYTAAVIAALSPAEEIVEDLGSLSSVLTYDQGVWHRPGIDEFGGGAFENVTKPADPRRAPDAKTFNQLTRQLVALAKLASSVRLQVEFVGGAPQITALAGLASFLEPGDFGLTDNGNGDTSITLSTWVAEWLRPLELTVVGDVEIDRARVFPITNGWRVKTKLGATGTDAPFVLALHAPAAPPAN